MRLTRRAEAVAPATLVETFVDVGAMFTRLSSADHQILYGRRGTGKTHALQYLAAQAKARGEIAVYIDLQTLGSSGGVYADPHLDVPEAGTRLLVDTLSAIHEELLDAALDTLSEPAVDSCLPILEKLADDITDVEIRGEEERRFQTATQVSDGSHTGISAAASSRGPSFELSATADRTAAHSDEHELIVRGRPRHRVHFGTLSSTLRKLVKALPHKRLWLLLDEWSNVPTHLQPYLADLLRRSLFPVHGVSVKIAAIEQRSTFRLDDTAGSYVGIEVGADAAADVDLDDFMVFGSDEESASRFFGQLLIRHLTAISAGTDRQRNYSSAEAFIRSAFTQEPAFRELVRAAEGVPRDAINIIQLAATKANDRHISLDHVRSAARTWYLRDKEKAVESKPEARALLHWIIDRVIAHRRARAFLLQQHTDDLLIRWLYDARVLHLVKRGISATDRPGVRFDAYALDYGCYVDLLVTQRAPKGLLPTDDPTRFVDIPPDDYRSIRSAILELDEFGERRLPIKLRLGGVRWLRKDHLDADMASALEVDHSYLIATADNYLGAIPLDSHLLRIGSDETADIQILDQSVDRRHALVGAVEGGAQLHCERGSVVYVNNARRLHETMSSGDELRIGSFVFQVMVMPPPAVAPQ